MATAIRIDGTGTIHGRRHIDLVRQYQEENSLTDDEIDTMIETGRIEFGSVYLSKGQLLFEGDKTRNMVYRSIDRMIEINGR